MAKTSKSLVAVMAMVLGACTAAPPAPAVQNTKMRVYVGNDDLAGPDGDVHPQVVRITITKPDGTTSSATGRLSSSNTITTAAHAIRPRGGVANVAWSVIALAGSTAQQNALNGLGMTTLALEHPLHARLSRDEDKCYGADIGVLVFPEARSIPRTLLRPLGVVPESETEPGCGGFDYCVTLLGAGLGGPFTNGEKCAGPVTTGINFLNMERGLRTGSCTENSDMLSGEYDYDDSSPCDGDSGAPILLRATGKVLAQHVSRGGDAGDDSIGPVFWNTRGSPNGARQWLWQVALDRDGDGVEAADDTCDRVPNLQDADFDGDGIGDACDDSDGDGILDADEIAAGTKPDSRDSDEDGLDDPEELRRGTDPRVKDSDADGLRDGDEVARGLDPLDNDSDDDDLSDGDEVNVYKSNPFERDSDRDGLLDGEEVRRYRTNPTLADTDNDLLEDGLEVRLRLDPTKDDTDGDGLIDGKDPQFVLGAIQRLPDEAVKPSKNPLYNALEQAERKALAGDVPGAFDRIDFLRKKMDGCGSAPGSDDWIVVCADQEAIRTLLDLLRTNLGR